MVEKKAAGEGPDAKSDSTRSQQKRGRSSTPWPVTVQTPTGPRFVWDIVDLVEIQEQTLFDVANKRDEERLEEIRRRLRVEKVPMACAWCGRVVHLPSEPESSFFCSEFCRAVHEAVHRPQLTDSPAQALPVGDIRSAIPPRSPDEAVEWMNARHFVVNERGRATVITEQEDPVLKRRVLVRSTFADLRNLYLHRYVDPVNEDEKPRRLATYWLNHSRRRQYAGIVCAPGADVGEFFNLWRGFSVSAIAGDWSLMEEHIGQNVCGGGA